MLKMLRGKRTYIVAVIMGVLSSLQFLGIIDGSTQQAILSALTSLGLIASRTGTSKKYD